MKIMCFIANLADSAEVCAIILIAIVSFIKA